MGPSANAHVLSTLCTLLDKLPLGPSERGHYYTAGKIRPSGAKLLALSSKR